MQTTKHATVHQIGLNCFLLKVGLFSTVMQGKCTNSDIIMNKGKALRGKDIHGAAKYSENKNDKCLWKRRYALAYDKFISHVAAMITFLLNKIVSYARSHMISLKLTLHCMNM